MNQKTFAAAALSLTLAFGACADDENRGNLSNPDWKITLDIDLPHAREVRLHTVFWQEAYSFADWEEPFVDWGDQAAGGPTRLPHAYEAGQYTITLQGKGGLSLTCPGICLKSIDISQCSTLGCLNVCDNDLSELSLGEQEYLQVVECDTNNISSLDLLRYPQLKTLSCAHNALDSLDLSKNPYLERLCCNDNNLQKIKLGLLFNLTYVAIHNNPLSDEAYNAIFNALPAKTEDNPGLILLDPGKGDVSILAKKYWRRSYPSQFQQTGDSETNQ